MKLIELEGHDGNPVYINPDYVVGITVLQKGIQIIGQGTEGATSQIHMTNMDANRVKGLPDEVAAKLNGYEQAQETA